MRGAGASGATWTPAPPAPIAGIVPRGFATLLSKEVWRFAKVLTQTVFAPVITNCLYLTIFGVAFRTRASAFPGVSYMQFLVPGLVVLGIIQNAFQNTSSSIIIAKYQGTITDLLVVPMRPFEIAAAFALGGAVRGMIVGGATFATALFFVDVPLRHPFLLLASALAVGTAFSAFGGIVAIYARDFDHIARVQYFVLTPLVFLGGVFFAVGDIPADWRFLAYGNPIFYMTSLLRFAFLGLADFPVAVSLAAAAGFTALSVAFLYSIFRTGRWLLV